MRGLSLGTKLTLGTAFLIAAAVASSAWYSVSSLESFAQASGEARRRDLEGAYQREAQLLTRNAAASSASLLATSDYTRLEETAVRVAAENPNVIWIALVEPSGAVVAATQKAPAKQGGRIEDPLAPKVAASTPGKVEQMADPANAANLLLGTQVFLPDSTGKEVGVGTVRLAFDMSALEHAKQDAIAQGRKRARESTERQLLFAALILAIGLLLALYQALRISRPLITLSEHARQIANGDFDRRVAIKRKDEVGQLGASFNWMSERLKYLVEEMGRKASMEHEIEVARSIQGLMTPPPDAVTFDACSLIGRCEMASACGGDWWTYRQLDHGRLLIVVGDVTGHGMPSAMIAATGRGAVESLTFVHHGITPQLVLQAIDRAIRDIGEKLLMTCFAMIISPDGRVEYANAGHTAPYLLSTNFDQPGKTGQPGLEVLITRSNPLGSYRPLIASGTSQLYNGDFLVMNSDGLTDRLSQSGTRFGEKRLRKTLIEQASRGANNVQTLCDRIVDEVAGFGGEHPVDDDITLVVLQYTGEARGSRKSLKRGAAA